MELINTIKNNFNKGYFNKAMLIEGLPEEYPAWTIKSHDWVGVAVPADIKEPFSEHFSQVWIKTERDVTIGGEKTDLIMLTCSDMELRNEFATICSQFVQPGIGGADRKSLIKSPELWWKNWKYLLGNVNTSIESYPVLGELIVLEKLIVSGSDAVWGGASGATNDIEVAGHSYEVKSTIQRTSNEVTINGINQMKKGENELDLVFCRFERSLQGRNINELVESLVEKGLSRTYLENELDKVNLEKGCTARNMKYKLLEMKIYPVNDKFPSVTFNSFKGDKLPDNIVKFTYTVDLSGLETKSNL